MIDSTLDESSWDDCLTFAEIKGRLMATFFSINKTVMVDNTKNEIEYFKNDLLNLERTATIVLKQVDEDSEHIVIDSRDRSGDEISANSLHDLEEQVEGEGKKELLRMPEDQDDSDLGIVPTTHKAPLTHSPDRTAEQVDQDFDNQNMEELAQVDAVIHNIALMELDGAKNPDGQALKEDHTDNVDVDW